MILLESKISLLKEAENFRKGSKGSDNSDVVQDTNTNKYKEQVQYYKFLTNISLELEDNGKTCVCTARNRAKKRLTKFSLTKAIEQEKSNELNYAPLANAHLLPEYLQTELTFEKDLSTVLVADVLSALYNDEEA